MEHMHMAGVGQEPNVWCLAAANPRSRSLLTVPPPYHHQRTNTHPTPHPQALIRRKVKVVDRDEIVQLRVPNAPIPLSWGRTVQPYVPMEQREQRKMAGGWVQGQGGGGAVRNVS